MYLASELRNKKNIVDEKKIKLKDNDTKSEIKVNLPDEEALKALMGARSGFCITRKVLLKPLLRQVTTRRLI